MSLDNLPDVQFCSTDAEEIEKNVITVYEGLTEKTLFPGDPVRLFLEGLAAVVIQQRHLIDYTGKQNLLKYSIDDNLENLGAMTDTKRLLKAPALTTIRFSMASPLGYVLAIQKGNRVSPDGKLMFETAEYAEIIPGELFVDVPVQCQTAGNIGNGLLPGQLSKLVDPLDHITEVANIDTTAGGADIEENDNYRERIRLAPESFSVAGPTGAYQFHAKSAHQDIVDVAVYQSSDLDTYSDTILQNILTAAGIDPAGLTTEEMKIKICEILSPSTVKICPLLKGGEIPGQSILDLVIEGINERKTRPLTDITIVSAPVAVPYNIDITYFISEANKLFLFDIQAAVLKAVDDFKTWQKSKLGRDVNPDRLTHDLIAAGAYRIDINEAMTQAVEANQVAIAQTVTINYGGLINE